MKPNLIDNDYLKNNYKDFYHFIRTKRNVCILGNGLLKKPFIIKNKVNNTNVNNKVNNIIKQAVNEVINKVNNKKYDLYIGTKNTLSILPRRDILQLNDFEGLFGNEIYIKELKYILFPINIHYKCIGGLDITYLNMIEYIYSYNFRGKLIIYKLDDPIFEYNLMKFKKENINIKCNIYNLDYIKINSKSSADIFNNLMIKLSINFELKIDYYGICKDTKCNPEIEKNLKESKCLNKYSNIKKGYIERKYNKKSESYYEKYIPKYVIGFEKNKFIKSKFN